MGIQQEFAFTLDKLKEIWYNRLMPIKDKYVNVVCPRCQETAEKSDYQYMPLHYIYSCDGCEIRWRTPWQQVKYFGVVSTKQTNKKEREKHLEQQIAKLIHNLGLG